MSHGRKISDDDLVEISGGMDTDLDMERFTQRREAPQNTPPGRVPPGGSPDLEPGRSGGGDSGIGPS